MKSNIIMKSEYDRDLFGTIIRQETKSGFLNLSDLQLAYNKQALIHGWSIKRYNDLLFTESNMERIYYLAKEQGFIFSSFLEFMERVKNETPAKLLKKIGMYKQTGARHTNTVWAHKSIFVLLAMEMNPMFYVKTVIWLSDDLIISRIEAGNFCKALNASIQKFNPSGTEYITLAKALNHIVFGKHEAGIRNTGSSRQLKELEDIEKQMAFNIDYGLINTFDELLSILRKIWHNKVQLKLI